jgi:ribonuclease BN (tRNA processing enzyme)
MAVAHPKRSSAAIWLETAESKLVLDFGASAHHRLAQEQLDWWDLDAVWISHFHVDHCLGLVAFLFATRHAPQTRSRTKPMRIVGSQGIRELLDRFDRVNDYKLLDQPFDVEIVEVGALERFELAAGLTAIAMRTPHTKDSLAIRIEGETGKTLIYTSDTGFGKEIAAFSKHADLMIIESSYVKNKAVEIHLELAEAMYLIREARPKRAMLNHFYAEWDEVDLNREVAMFDPLCEVIEAVDGLRVDV